jgi:phenylpropionate dioxygenase-like ring-hydroxylating dioxygenase large terminal subunit
MIRNQWYAVLESYEVKPGKVVGVTRMGEKMVFWRTASGKASCLSDLCPHRGAAISLGKVTGDCIQCPFHGFEYDTSGRCTLIPANGKAAPVPKAMQVRAYPVQEAHNFIWIWWGEERAAYPALPFFDDLEDGFSYTCDQDHWQVHYTRAIENQLDVFHLPFVHDTTIGRGNRTIADGPGVRLDGDKMDIWVYNRLDDGASTAVKPTDLPEPKRAPFLKFNFPNLWMNRISDDMRIVVSFVPVDDGNTFIYLRYYQRMVRIPILRDLVNLLNKLFSRVILGQDKRVVLTQRPIRSELKMGEKVISQDRPIVVYRTHREELKNQ